MKNRRILTMGSTIVILVLVIVVLGWGILRKTQLDASSANLVVETVSELLNAADRTAVLALMSPDNFEAETKEDLSNQFILLKRQLGRLESIDRLTGTADVPLLPFFRSPTAAYEMDLSMLAGPIQVRVELNWENGRWLFTELVFTGDLLRN